jgi:hypothetical protein
MATAPRRVRNSTSLPTSVHVFGWKVPGFDWEAPGFDWEVPVVDWEVPVVDWRHSQPAAAPRRSMATTLRRVRISTPLSTAFSASAIAYSYGVMVPASGE